MDTFAQILLTQRARFNARFAEARHFKPSLDPAAFGDLLRNTVAPIVEAVYQTHPGQAHAAAEALYDLALDLLGQDCLGPNARHPAIVSGWTYLLPQLAGHLAAEPRTIIGAVTNALYNLATTSGARPGEWLRDMIDLAALCPDVPTLLKAGQVCAWRCGMAHYRPQALNLCQALPARIASRTLGLAEDPAPPLDSVLSRLQADPWWQPANTGGHDRASLRIVARVGAFRGFGGLFIAPPNVEFSGEHFLVSDGEGTWLLAADAFGATFHRLTEPAPTPKIKSPFRLNRAGEVACGDDKRLFPELAQSTSHAANRTTLAVTMPHSHAIYLVGLAS